MIRPNRFRANIVIITASLVVITILISIVSYIMQLQLLNEPLIERGDAMNNDFRVRVILYGFGLIRVVAFISFILWMRRAYVNLHQSKTSLLHTEGWAAGGWFVPILNFYIPYQILNEVWTKTQLKIRKEVESVNLVSTWWLFYILVFCLSLINSFYVIIYRHERTVLTVNTIGQIIIYTIYLFHQIIGIQIIYRMIPFELELKDMEIEDEPENHLIIPDHSPIV